VGVTVAVGVEVMVGGDVIAVPAATAYRVALEADPQGPEGAGKDRASGDRDSADGSVDGCLTRS